MDDVTCLHSFVYSTCVSQVAPYPMMPCVVQNGLEHTRGISALPNPELGFPSDSRRADSLNISFKYKWLGGSVRS